MTTPLKEYLGKYGFKCLDYPLLPVQYCFSLSDMSIYCRACSGSISVSVYDADFSINEDGYLDLPSNESLLCSLSVSCWTSEPDAAFAALIRDIRDKCDELNMVLSREQNSQSPQHQKRYSMRSFNRIR